MSLTKKFIISAPKKNSQKGFTLLEVIVAVTILGTGLVTVIGLFSAGLRTASISNDYSTALFLLKKKFGDIELRKTYSSASGTFDSKGFSNYRWNVSVVPYPLPVNTESKLIPHILKITVTVKWSYGKKQNKVSISTLKTVL